MSRELDPITQEEIALALEHMSERVARDRRRMLDPIVRASLRRLLVALERHIPGLDPPRDASSAHLLASSAAAALVHNREREALARSLRGLSFAPHSPELHYLAATACLELGAVREALCLLAHTLWIHPGHPHARRDLETLTACRGVWEPWAGASVEEPVPLSQEVTEEMFEPQPRIVQRRIECGGALIEVDHAHRVHLQAHEFTIRPRQDGEHLGQDEQAQSGAKLEHQRHVGGYERRRAPRDLNHRAKQVMTRSRRKEPADIAENLRRVAHGIDHR